MLFSLNSIPVRQVGFLPREAELSTGEPERRRGCRRGRLCGGGQPDAVGAEGSAAAQQARRQGHLGVENQVRFVQSYSFQRYMIEPLLLNHLELVKRGSAVA